MIEQGRNVTCGDFTFYTHHLWWLPYPPKWEPWVNLLGALGCYSVISCLMLSWLSNELRLKGAMNFISFTTLSQGIIRFTTGTVVVLNPDLLALVGWFNSNRVPDIPTSVLIQVCRSALCRDVTQDWSQGLILLALGLQSTLVFLLTTANISSHVDHIKIRNKSGLKLLAFACLVNTTGCFLELHENVIDFDCRHFDWYIIYNVMFVLTLGGFVSLSVALLSMNYSKSRFMKWMKVHSPHTRYERDEPHEPHSSSHSLDSMVV